MAAIISCAASAGRVIAVQTNMATPLAVTFNGEEISELGIAISMDVDQGVAAQFQNAFDDSIYITPFGDMPGTVAISFIVNEVCDNPVARSNDAVVKYLTSRLRPTKLVFDPNVGWVFQRTEPVIVAVGKASFYGYITGLRINATTQGGIFINATLIMKAWPV